MDKILHEYISALSWHVHMIFELHVVFFFCRNSIELVLWWLVQFIHISSEMKLFTKKKTHRLGSWKRENNEVCTLALTSSSVFVAVLLASIVLIFFLNLSFVDHFSQERKRQHWVPREQNHKKCLLEFISRMVSLEFHPLSIAKLYKGYGILQRGFFLATG